MTEQLTFLQAGLAPKQWLCPTCRGNRTMLRSLYPDEKRETGLDTRLEQCRSCHGQGWVPWDPEDLSIPY